MASGHDLSRIGSFPPLPVASVDVGEARLADRRSRSRARRPLSLRRRQRPFARAGRARPTLRPLPRLSDGLRRAFASRRIRPFALPRPLLSPDRAPSRRAPPDFGGRLRLSPSARSSRLNSLRLFDLEPETRSPTLRPATRPDSSEKHGRLGGQGRNSCLRRYFSAAPEGALAPPRPASAVRRSSHSTAPYARDVRAVSEGSNDARHQDGGR